MRILHVNNFAGVGSALAQLQREAGLESQVLSFVKYPYGAEEILLEGTGFGQLRAFARYLRWADVLHLHGGDVWGRWKQWSFPFLSSGKQVIRHYHGSDLRGYYHSGRCIVSTPDLLEYAPQGTWIPVPIDTEQFKPQPQKHQGIIIGVRGYESPYMNPNYTYADRTQDALKALETARGDFIIKVASHIPNTEMPAFLNSCDLLFDPKSAGWLSKLTLEAMSCALPTVSYVKETCLSQARDLHGAALFSYGGYPDDVIPLVKDLLDDATLRNNLGVQARRYVESHNAGVLIERKVREYYADDQRHIWNPAVSTSPLRL